MYRKEKLLENRDFIIIGENIRRLRRSKNYIQEYLAEKLHISANHVYRIENAEAHISMPLLLKIKHLFEVDANELLEDHDNGEKEISVIKTDGILLLVLNLALSGVVLLTIAQDTAKRYSEIMVISIAAYTFYKIIMAVVNMIKVRKTKSPILITIRNIGTADALVSLLTLQATMLASFQNESSLDRNQMNAITGLAVCILIAILGISMIRYAFVQEKES